MYPRIPRKLAADLWGSAEHTLGTTGLASWTHAQIATKANPRAARDILLSAVISCRLYQHRHGKNLLRTECVCVQFTEHNLKISHLRTSNNIQIETKRNTYFTHHGYMFRQPQCSHHQAVQGIEKLFI